MRLLDEGGMSKIYLARQADLPEGARRLQRSAGRVREAEELLGAALQMVSTTRVEVNLDGGGAMATAGALV